MLTIKTNRINQGHLFWLAVVVVLLVGFTLRLAQLEQYPLAVNQDELSNIYDGYSIAETGADRWGEKYPLILKGFGLADYRPPMYAWLNSVTISIFGFSVSSGRLVSALLGSLSLVFLFLVARRIGGHVFAFFALLLATLSPWHIILSRTASEGAVLPAFFLISACYIWQIAKAKEYSFGLLGTSGNMHWLRHQYVSGWKAYFFYFNSYSAR